MAAPRTATLPTVSAGAGACDGDQGRSVSVLASIPSPDSGTVDIGPLPLHMYGLLLAVGVLVAAWIAERRWVARGYDGKTFSDMAVWIVVGGVVGARVYHVISDYQLFTDDWLRVFQIWKGGLSIWGVLGGGIIAVIVMTRIKHVETLALMDCIAPGLLAAQAIGRWGNYFNQELFGGSTDLPWGLEISPDKRPPGFLDVATFHPTFLYESLYCLFLLGLLLAIERRVRFRKGQMTALYLATYTFGRFFFENLRVDPSNEIAGIRLNSWVSGVVCILSIAWFVWLGRRGSEYQPGTVPADGATPAIREAVPDEVGER
jgi:phosphatidylglycerol---prolipoprotein diacylglyceryl transferase